MQIVSIRIQIYHMIITQFKKILKTCHIDAQEKIHRAPKSFKHSTFVVLKKLRTKPNRFSAPFHTPAWLKPVL